jgi:ubiquinone/menaquinone biosynthesis C-methylase UbiE
MTKPPIGLSQAKRRGELQRKGAYGVDAPYLLPIPIALIAWNLWQGINTKAIWPFVATALVIACMGLGLYASCRGKFVVWDELLQALNLKGDERILDIGCGRGAVLLLAARHLSTGRAVGVDLWRHRDQSGNAARRTLDNAAKEGVADRVELHTGDMTALTFQDNSFDLVVSNIAIHNVKGAGRQRAIGEAVRVLRPGGRLMIADISRTGEYFAQLKELGMNDVGRRTLGWRMWWSGPWLPTQLVTAIKPTAAA